MSPHPTSRHPGSTALAAVAAVATIATAACGDGLTVPAGTTLVATLDGGLDPGTASAGDTLSARLAGDLVADGTVYLPAGTVLRGRVTAVQQADAEWPLVVKLAFDSITVRGARRPVRAGVTAVDTRRPDGGEAVPGDLVGSVLEGAAAVPMLQDRVARAEGTPVVLGTEAETVVVPPDARLELQLTAPLEVPAP